MISRLSEACRNSAYRFYIEPCGPLRKFKNIMTIEASHKVSPSPTGMRFQALVNYVINDK